MKNLYTYLTYAGSVPFIICALGFMFDVRVIPVLGNVEEVLGIYGLVIASFMAGIHWGQHLNPGNKWSLYLAITSNVNAVLLWLLYLILPFKALLIAFAASFLAVLVIDRKIFQDGAITTQYFHTRSIVTLIVILMLVISAIYA